MLAACAPEAWARDRGFQSWFAQLGTACEGKRIGDARVEDLVRGSTRAAIYFTDQTSRLYRGRITPDGWATGVSASLNGWRSDPGIRCVLDRYAEYRASAPPAPSD
ncbi:MAG: hypothetical protein P8Y76_12775 [bacterium]